MPVRPCAPLLLIAVAATRVDAFNHRVDAAWEPPVDGQVFYMQLQTRLVAQLRQMRGIVESVRFVPDSIRGARR